MIPTFEALRGKRANISIAHHIRGRIRLKLEATSVTVALPNIEAQQLQAQTVFDRMPGVHSVRVNLLARSCVVEYDAAVIPAAAWDDFLAGTNSPAAAILEQILRDSYEEFMHAKL